MFPLHITLSQPSPVLVVMTPVDMTCAVLIGPVHILFIACPMTINIIHLFNFILIITTFRCPLFLGSALPSGTFW